MSRIATTQRWLAMAGIAITSFLGCIDFTIVNTAVPALQSAFGVGVGQVQWVVTAFVLALSACTITVGRLADRHGLARALYASMVLFGAASLGAGLAQGFGALVAWRSVQGLACAGLYTASAAVVAALFPERERGRALGLLFSLNGLGLALGPVAGGLLVEGLGWRWIFLVNVPLVALGLLLCAGRIALPPATVRTDSVDWPGALLSLLVLPCGLAAIIHGQDWGWDAPLTLGLLAAAVSFGALFVLVQRRAAAPLLAPQLFRHGRFIAACVATAALACFYCAAFFLMPLYLGTVRGQSSAATGWLLLPTTAVMALVSPLAGRGCDRLGGGPVMAFGFAALLGSALMQSVFGADSAWAWVVAAFAMMGLGWGCILGPSMTSALAAVPDRHAATALGLATTVHNAGGALGLAAATVLQSRAAEAHGFLAGYRSVMLMLAAVSLATLAMLALKRRSLLRGPVT